MDLDFIRVMLNSASGRGPLGAASKRTRLSIQSESYFLDNSPKQSCNIPPQQGRGSRSPSPPEPSVLAYPKSQAAACPIRLSKPGPSIKKHSQSFGPGTISSVATSKHRAPKTHRTQRHYSLTNGGSSAAPDTALLDSRVV